jgi:hypothetical protein
MVIYLSIIHVVYFIFGHTQQCIQPRRRTPASFRRLTLLEMPIWKNRSFSLSFKGKHKTRCYRLYEIIFITMLYTLRNIITITITVYVFELYTTYIYICTIFMYIVYTLYLGLLFWIHLFTRYVDGQRLNHPSNYVSSTGFLAAHGFLGHCHGGHQGSRSNPSYCQLLIRKPVLKRETSMFNPTAST